MMEKKSEYEVIAEYSAAKQSNLSYFISMIFLFFFVGAFYFLSILVIVLLYYIIVHQSLLAITALIIFVSSVFYPTKILWQSFIDCRIWRMLCEYFSFKVIIDHPQYYHNLRDSSD